MVIALNARRPNLIKFRKLPEFRSPASRGRPYASLDKKATFSPSKIFKDTLTFISKCSRERRSSFEKSRGFSDAAGNFTG